MKFRSPFYCLAALAIALTTLMVWAASAPSPDEEIVTSPDRIGGAHYLNVSERRKFEQLALKGDLPASYCIANHYAYAANRGLDQEFWILIAAENGDSNAMMKISIHYENSKDQRTRDRAEFWRLRALATASQANVDCH